MRRSSLYHSLALLGVLVLAACGGNDAGDQTTTTIAVADETTTTAALAPGPVVVPEFAFPVPDGATRVITSEPGILELEFPGGDGERIAEFYEQWTNEQGSWIEGLLRGPWA